MSSRPKIGYLVPAFPGPAHGYAFGEIAAIEELGVDVAILSDAPAGIRPHDWSEAAMARTAWLDSRNPLVRLRALPSLPLGRMFGGGFAAEAWRALPQAAGILSQSRRQGFRHLHVLGCGPLAMAAALAERLGGPSYSLYLGRPLNEEGPGQNFKWDGARFALAATARILNEARFVLREDMPRVARVQPIGVDADFFQRETPYAPWKTGRLRLFSCGALRAGRGYTDALKALRILVDRGVDAELTIAGAEEPGSGQVARLQALIAQLRLEGRASLAGALDGAAVRAALLDAHIYLQPGDRETLGAGLIEAMSCGLPAIVAAAGGVRELVTDGRDGLLVRPRAPELIAGAAASLALNPELGRMLSSQARGRILGGLTARDSAARLLREIGLMPADHDDLMDDLPPAPAPRRTG